jgi:hypothetical protein
MKCWEFSYFDERYHYGFLMPGNDCDDRRLSARCFLSHAMFHVKVITFNSSPLADSHHRAKISSMVA